MGFKDEENLHTTPRFRLNEKNCYKFADLFVYNNESFYHIVFVKIANYFTLLLSDYKTNLTFELLSTALEMLKSVDFAPVHGVDSPNTEILNELYNNLDSKQSNYKTKNYIINTNKEQPCAKEKKFFINQNIPLVSANVLITNMDTNFDIIIEKSALKQMGSYDKYFSLYVEDEKCYPNLLCLESQEKGGKIQIRLVSEHQYHLKNSVMDKTTFSGNSLWAFQMMEYAINADRDIKTPIMYEGKELPKQLKRYFFVFSVNGIKFKNDIRFGMVTFSNESGIGAKNEDVFNTSLEKPSDCYAQLVVVKETLSEAINEAVTLVIKVMNILSVIIMDDSPLQLFGLNTTVNHWNYEVLQTKLSFDDHFYVEDAINNKNNVVMAYKHKQKEKTFIPSVETEILLNNDNLLENYFYSEGTKEKEDLLQAIFWLNTSYNSTDKKIKIIALYNSVEFLISGQKGKTLDEELKSEYGKEYEELIVCIKEKVEKAENKELFKRIYGVISNSFEGNSSAKSKLEMLVKQLDLSLSEEEWDLFDKLKKNRHNLIHNKKIKAVITKQDLQELYHLFSKLIIHKINSMEGDKL